MASYHGNVVGLHVGRGDHEDDSVALTPEPEEQPLKPDLVAMSTGPRYDVGHTQNRHRGVAHAVMVSYAVDAGDGMEAASVMHESRVESNAIHRRAFGSYSYADWLRVLERSLQSRVVDGVPMPAFPPQGHQTATHGTSGRLAIAEAGRFVSIVHQYAEAEGQPIGEASRVLDFGCGWGRMLRLFLNRVDSQYLHGVDVRPESVAVARQLNPFSRFATVNGLPPSPFDEGMFNLVIAYSVFSHLSEDASRAWIREIARVLQPGGLAIVTTQGREFLDFVERLTTRSALWRVRLTLGRWRGRPWNEQWLRGLRESFGDIAMARRQVAAGQFVHAATGGGAGLEASLYGESIIPRAYVEREWTAFELVDFLDDRRRLPQAVIVLRKPSVRP